MKGRRRPDTPHGSLPDDIQPGDYWKVIKRDSSGPMLSAAASNLTGYVWTVVAPFDDGSFGIGDLRQHTVREHEDGTISVRPGDGSSNSIAISRGDRRWHGYIEHGEWRTA